MTLVSKIIIWAKNHIKLSIVIALLAIFSIYRIIASSTSSIKVESTKVTRGDIIQTVSTSGKVKADNYSVLSFQTAGLVNWVGVKEGDKVLQGQALAQLDTVPLNAIYQQALNNYRNYQAAAENVLDQIKNHSSDETFAQKATRTAAEVARDNAYDAVKAAQDNLRNAILYAPFNGVVTDINQVNAGVAESPVSANITVADPNTVYFDAEVEETDLPNVSIGQKVNIKLDAYPDKTFTGAVANIGFVAFTSSTGGNAYDVRITLPENSDMRFKVGMQGDSNIVYATVPNVIKINTSSLVNDAGKTYVWKIVNGKTKKVEVEIGAASNGETEIKSGATEGDEVVDSPASNLKEGQKISI